MGFIDYDVWSYFVVVNDCLPQNLTMFGHNFC